MKASDTVLEAECQAILRSDLTSFIERAFYELNSQTAFVPGVYVELIAAALETCRTGKTKRLIINLPPRTLRSHAASVVFPAWILGHDPSKQIICVSYVQDLADKHARDCRTLMSSPVYRDLFPGAVLRADKQSVADFVTSAQGGRLSTSVGGVLTGRGADIIIDDPMKLEDALSETRRRTANEWHFNTLLSRLNSKEDGIIIVMQRLHQNDLVGEFLDKEHWEVLSLPAIAERGESFQIDNLCGKFTFERKAGEVLHPERDSLATYQKIRETVGEYNFQSQYQHNPTTREGGLIKREWLKYCQPEEWPKAFEYTLQSWDTAIKSDERHDYSICTTWGVYNGNFYLMDVFRRRLTLPQLKRAVLELLTKHDLEKLLIED